MENLNGTLIVLVAIATYLLYKVIHEIAFIKFYAFLIRLRSEGKLVDVTKKESLQTK